MFQVDLLVFSYVPDEATWIPERTLFNKEANLHQYNNELYFPFTHLQRCIDM